MHEFSKAVFKTGFYFCIFIDKMYHNTSIIDIGGYLKEKIADYGFLKEMHEFFEETIILSITKQYKANFNDIRKSFTAYVFNLLENGTLHRKINSQELVNYLFTIFSGFPYLIQRVRQLELYEKSKK